MNIERVVWLREIVDKLARKHHVLPEEVEQALSSKPRFYLVQRGERAAGLYTLLYSVIAVGDWIVPFLLWGAVLLRDYLRGSGATP